MHAFPCARECLARGDLRHARRVPGAADRPSVRLKWPSPPALAVTAAQWLYATRSTSAGSITRFAGHEHLKGLRCVGGRPLVRLNIISALIVIGRPVV